MKCEIHNFDLPGPCPYCLDIIIKKENDGTLTPDDLELVNKLKKVTDDEVTKFCNRMMGIE